MEEEKSNLVKCSDCNHLRVDVSSGCFYCNELSPNGTRLSVTLHLAHSCLKFNCRESIKIKNTSKCCCNCKYFRASTGKCHNLENARLIGNEIILVQNLNTKIGMVLFHFNNDFRRQISLDMNGFDVRTGLQYGIFNFLQIDGK